jgi:hypothetical protein
VDTQRVVGIARGEVVEAQVLVGCQVAARQLGPRHHDPLFAASGLARQRALVAVVLLVDAVELEQLVFVVGEARHVARERCPDGAAQMVALYLQALDAGERGLCAVFLTWIGRDHGASRAGRLARPISERVLPCCCQEA